MGQICHADADYVKYNYAGLWEKDRDGRFVCNYQQFMPASEAATSLREQATENEEEDELEDRSDDELDTEDPNKLDDENEEDWE